MSEKNFITADEILKHRTADSMWLVIDSKVYVQVSNRSLRAVHPSGDGLVRVIPVSQLQLILRLNFSHKSFESYKMT